MITQNKTNKISTYLGTTIVALAAAVILYDNIPKEDNIPNTRSTKHEYGLSMDELESNLDKQIPNIRTAYHNSLIPYIKTFTEMLKKSNSNQLDALNGEGKVNDAQGSYSRIISVPFDPIIQEACEKDSINLFRYNKGVIEEIKITFEKGSKKDYDDYHSGKILGISPREITVETYVFEDPHKRTKHGKEYELKLDTYNKNYTLGDIVERFNNRR